MGWYEEVLARRPVRYWRLGEAVGPSAADELAVGVGTYTGGVTLGQPSLVRSDPNLAIAGDGRSGYVNVPDHATLDLGNGPMSIICFARLNTIATPQSFADKGSGAYIWRTDALGREIFRRNGFTTLCTATSAITPGTTNFHAVTYDGTTVKLWRNAVDVSGATTAATLTDTAGALILGAADNGTVNWIDGFLDEVAIFNTVLSAADIAALYAAALGSLPPILRRHSRGLILR